MGTTVDKLQKLLQSKQSLVNIVNEKAGTNYTINSKLSDVINSVNNISVETYQEYEGEFEGNGELVLPGFSVQLYYETNYYVNFNYPYTKLKIGSKPTSENDYDFNINTEYEFKTLISNIENVNKIYVWGYGISNMNSEYVDLESNGYTTYSNAYEITITQDCSITLVYPMQSGPSSIGGYE